MKIHSMQNVKNLDIYIYIHRFHTTLKDIKSKHTHIGLHLKKCPNIWTSWCLFFHPTNSSWKPLNPQFPYDMGRLLIRGSLLGTLGGSGQWMMIPVPDLSWKEIWAHLRDVTFYIFTNIYIYIYLYLKINIQVNVHTFNIMYPLFQ